MMDDPQKFTSRLARWSGRLALFSAALAFVGLVLHRLTSFPTPVAINVFLVSVAGLALAVLAGLLSLFGIWRKGYAGAGSACLGITLPLLILAWPMTYVPALLKLPPVIDVTTDWTTPPRFEALAAQHAEGGKPAAYPADTFATVQQQVYPDLRSITIDRSADETFELAEEAVRKLRWRVAVSEAPATRAGRTGVIEATEHSLVLGFPDDISIRVAGNNARSRIDIRSAARYGSYDFGRNAAHVREFYAELQAQMDATLPSTVAGRRRLRTTRGAAVIKRLKERDQPKAAPRLQRDRAPSSARRERGQKESPR
jgi:hypothetical protein